MRGEPEVQGYKPYQTHKKYELTDPRHFQGRTVARVEYVTFGQGHEPAGIVMQLCFDDDSSLLVDCSGDVNALACVKPGCLAEATRERSNWLFFRPDLPCEE
jgi:hypothetical protein